jgi:hypothetical protein
LSPNQPQLFATPARLEDVDVLVRLAAAERVMASDPGMSRDERAALLLAVVCPSLGAER